MMDQPANRPAIIPAMLKCKCPNCRKGDAFVNKSVFPLTKCLRLVEHCSVCHNRMMTETNNGPGINYAITVILFFINLAWYWPIFGLSYMDNSIYYYMATSTAVVILVQPWTMRYSRMIYLYMLVGYRSDKYVKKAD